jgi:predicted TIM-barrel fold metal-dependent hydrolase
MMDRTAPIIDFHTHFLVRQVLDQCLPHSVASNRGHHQLPPHLFALFEKMMSPQGVIGDMDRLQIDMSVISSAAVISPIYWAEPSVALRLAQQLNDAAAEWAASSPKRIIGSFVLPLQDMNLAIQELNPCGQKSRPQGSERTSRTAWYLSRRRAVPTLLGGGTGFGRGDLHAP